MVQRRASAPLLAHGRGGQHHRAALADAHLHRLVHGYLELLEAGPRLLEAAPYSLPADRGGAAERVAEIAESGVFSTPDALLRDR